MMEPSTVSPLLHAIRRMVWLATAITVISCAVFFVQLWRWERGHRHRPPRIVAHHLFVGPTCTAPRPMVTTAGPGPARSARQAVTAYFARPAVGAAAVADPHAVWTALGLAQLDARTYTIDRALATAVMAAPRQAMRGERIVPVVRGGQPYGFRLFHLTADSALTAIGLHDGDTLLAINGTSLVSRESSALMADWRTESVYELSFEARDGHRDVRNLVFR